MPEHYLLRKVFVPGGQPTVTYVDRDHLGLETQLRRALMKGHTVVAVTGSTKSGKTVLCKKVVPEATSIWLEGGQIKSIEDVAEQLNHKLNIPDSVARGTQDEVTAGVSLIASLGGKTGDNQTLTWKGASLLKAYKALRRKDFTLIIDDFHYVPREVQEEFVRSIKSEVFNGLPVILISVPHRAFDVVRVENEMQGRFSHIKVGPWSNEDLKKIIEKGEAALNIEFADKFEEFATQTGMDVARIREWYASADKMSRLSYSITEEKVINMIMAKAKIKEVDAKLLKEEQN